jgi:hypothetical protein
MYIKNLNIAPYSYRYGTKNGVVWNRKMENGGYSIMSNKVPINK